MTTGPGLGEDGSGSYHQPAHHPGPDAKRTSTRLMVEIVEVNDASVGEGG